MQQIINTGKCRVLLVPVPEDATSIEIEDNLLLYRSSFLTFDKISRFTPIEPGSWQILALAKDVTEEQMEYITKRKQVYSGLSVFAYWDWINLTWSCLTVKESFASLCTAYNIQPNDLILIEKA